MASLQFIDNHKKAYATIYTNELDKNGKRKRKRFTIKNDENLSKKEFERYAREEAEKKEQSMNKASTFNKVTKLGEFAKFYFFEDFARDTYSINTAYLFGKDYNNLILPYFGETEIGKIKVVDIQTWINKVKKEYSYSMADRALSAMKAIMAEAFRLEVIDDNPAPRVLLKRDKPARKIKPFTKKDLELLIPKIKELENKNKGMMVGYFLGIYTGLRIGEILGLTWDDIDFDNLSLRVERQRSTVGGTGWHTMPPKSSNAKRTVYFPPQLAEILKEWKKEQAEQRKEKGFEIFYDEEYEEYFDFVVTGEKGKSINRELFNYYLKKWIGEINEEQIKLAKINGTEPYNIEYKSFHSFRHFYASLLVSIDVPLVETRDLMGHGDISTTFQVYADSLDDKKTKNKIKNAFSDIDEFIKE